MKPMMRNALSGSLLMALTMVSAAAAQCDLTVTQTRTDFGNFNRGSVTQHANSEQLALIGTRSSQVTVICDAPTRIALYYHAPSSTNGKAFRLGDRASLILRLSNAQTDDHSVSLVQFASGHAQNNAKETQLLSPNIGVTPDTTDKASRFTFQLDSMAVLNDISSRITAKEMLTNQGSLEVVSYD